jgi:hypothetical protein
MMRAVTALAGVVLVAVPVAADPRGLYPVAGLGLLCALVIGWPQRGTAAARRAAAAVRARAGIPGRAGIPAGAGVRARAGVARGRGSREPAAGLRPPAPEGRPRRRAASRTRPDPMPPRGCGRQRAR